MHKFGVKIDLSDFFHDERKFVMILVDPAWENVKFLQHRVEEVFGIHRVRFLTTEGCFIPQEEPIEIIKYIDGGLKGFISARRRAKHSKSKQNAAVEERCSTLAEEQMGEELLPDVKKQVTLKKRRHFSLESGLASGSQKQAEELSKCEASAHATVGYKLPIINNKLNKISSTNEQQQLNTVEMGVEKKSSRRDKRKRQRKNKKEGLEEPTESVTQEQAALDQSSFSHDVIPSSTLFLTLSNQGKRDAGKKNRKCESTKPPKLSPNKIKSPINHNGYKGDIVSTTTEQLSDSNEQSEEGQTETVNSKKIIFHCSLNNVDMSKPRIFQAVKSSIDIHEQLIATAYTSTSKENVADKHEETEKVEAMIEIIDDELNSIEDDHSQLNSFSIIAVDEDETSAEQVSEIIDLNETEYVI